MDASDKLISLPSETGSSKAGTGRISVKSALKPNSRFTQDIDKSQNLDANEKSQLLHPPSPTIRKTM